MSETLNTNTFAMRYLLLPTLFLIVALLGGVRMDATTKALVFVAPPLISLILAALLMSLFVRGRLVEVERWFSQKYSLLKNCSHALTVSALFFASAQAFNSVLPEQGLMNWLLSFFFLWTLWNNQFSNFDARKLLKSLAAMFALAFVIKHFLLASLYAPDGGVLKRLTTMLFEGVTLGTLDAPAFAPASGYISFFTLAVFAVALILLLASAPEVRVQEDSAPRRLAPPDKPDGREEMRKVRDERALVPAITPRLATRIEHAPVEHVPATNDTTPIDSLHETFDPEVTLMGGTRAADDTDAEATLVPGSRL